jgi:cytochrome d ubiquinol oxidase subunit II
VLRGTAYALRSGTVSLREQRIVEIVLACSSILTPFALGAAIGGIASGRVPVGNASGDLVSSWLNSTSALTGGLAVVTAAYLAAVYLAADGVRLGDAELVRAYRVRALVTGLVAGAVALGGLLVVRSDARPIWDGLTSGSGLAAVIVSAAAGTATLVAILQGRFQLARGTAALAVAAIAVGWVLAQRPVFLPGLTIEEAAAGRSTLWAMIITVAIGAVVLVPSLFFLFRLVLRGRFDEHEPQPEPPAVATRARSRVNLLLVAGACLVIGAGLMLVVDARWALIVGVVGLFGFLVTGFVEVATAAVEGTPEE